LDEKRIPKHCTTIFLFLKNDKKMFNALRIVSGTVKKSVKKSFLDGHCPVIALNPMTHLTRCTWLVLLV